VTLTIHTEEDEQRQLNVTVEVEESRVQARMQQVARQLGRDLRIPGFRRGKVPYRVIVGRFGEASIRAEAVEELVEPVFTEALAKIEFEPYAPAELQDIDMEPLVLKFTLPLQPQVELGDYRALRREIPPVTLKEGALDEALVQVQERHAVVEPVERPIEAGDMVTLKGKAIADDEEETVVFDEERIDFLMDGEKVYFGQPLVDALLGLAAGESKEFTITLPEEETDEEEAPAAEAAEEADADAEGAEGDAAGDAETPPAPRNATFTVEILDVKRRELPALDDDLAKEDGDHETFAELRAALEEDLLRQAKEEAKSDLLEAVVDDLLETAQMVFPPAVLNSELDSMVENFNQQVTQAGWKWEDYLKLNEQAESDLRAEWEERATTRVQRGLILQEFIAQEKLTVDRAEIDAAVEERLEAFDNEQTKAYMRDWLSGDSGRNMLGNDLLMDKIHARMEAILTGNAPDLEALAAAEEEE